LKLRSHDVTAYFRRKSFNSAAGSLYQNPSTIHLVSRKPDG
jgi:hypothetical protein